MQLRAHIASSVGKAARWGAVTLLNRTPGNLPGVIAKRLAPHVLEDISKGSEVVAVITGTNGKTTTNNLLADLLAKTNRPVIANREGNNLETGAITAFLAPPEQSKYVSVRKNSAEEISKKSQIKVEESIQKGAVSGVGLRDKNIPLATIECDELYTRFVVPQVKPRFFVLLNLFRDQLDRFGSTERISDAIIEALEKSPQTTFVFNADDPLCAGIAQRVPNTCIGFGVNTALGAEEDASHETYFCQVCGAPLSYSLTHYSHLGVYECTSCDWKRPVSGVFAHNVRLEDDGYACDITQEDRGVSASISTHVSGVYMIYNVLAVAAVGLLSGHEHIEDGAFINLQEVMDVWRPSNGRLQRYRIEGKNILSNLAKNPTGFNQNIRIVQAEQGCVVAFYVNDAEGDGLDISWYWDVDFESLANIENLIVYVGGSRALDLQVRLKYAGIPAQVVNNAHEVIQQTSPDSGVIYMIANYTALPEIRSELNQLESAEK